MTNLSEIDNQIIKLLNIRKTLLNSESDSVENADVYQHEFEKIFLVSKFDALCLKGTIVPDYNSTCLGNFDISNCDVVCQGVSGAYSHIVCNKLFCKEPTFLPSFEEVFKAVANNNCYGVIPIENSTAGFVGENLALLQKNNLFIVGEYCLPISHCLLVKNIIDLKDITEIISHPQALAQCSNYLKATFPNAKIIEGKNTALSAEYVSKSKENCAAISSLECEKIYNLKVIAKNIQDFNLNSTRFLIISKYQFSNINSTKISISFCLENKKNSLAKFLDCCVLADINLTKIYSTTIPNKDFEIRFFLDFDGNINNRNIHNFFTNIANITTDLKFFGNYIRFI